MTRLGRTGILAFGLGWVALVGLLIWATPAPLARAEVLAPGEGGGAPSEGSNTPLHDMPTWKSNKVLLPLADKWVSISLRTGQSVKGRLVDIRVDYVVLRGSDGKDQRIQRRDIAIAALVVSPAARPRVTVPPREATPLSAQDTASRLTSMVGRVVRIHLSDGSTVQGVLRDVSAQMLRLETDTETVTVPVEKIKTFLVGRASARAGVDGGGGAQQAGGAQPGARRRSDQAGRSPGSAVLPHRYQGKDLADQAFRQSLLRKYTRIKENGVRLRNWGIGLMVAGLVMDLVGTSLALTAKSPSVAQFGYSLVGLSSTTFLVGVIMAPWGQVRHVRGIDMENTIYLTR